MASKFGVLRAASLASRRMRHGRRASTTTAVLGTRPHHSLGHDKSSGRLVFEGGPEGLRNRRFISKTWLRDSCRCNDCVNQDTMQRNFDTFQVSLDLQVEQIAQDDKGVSITWHDSHVTHHPWSRLLRFTNGFELESQNKLNKSLWDATIESAQPDVSFDDVMQEDNAEGMARLTANLHTHGLCFVSGTPTTPQASQKLLEHIGPIRNTHYGGFYDFIPDLSLADTAYTNLALDAHTDTTYFSEPVGLQAFHMLSHTPPPSGSAGSTTGKLGGRSLLVDGFRAAQKLQDEDPAAYRVLSRTRLPWHASGNKGVAMAPDAAYPVIEEVAGQLHRIRWNNDDRGAVPNPDCDEWYDAARKWVSIIRSPESEFRFQLEPGRLLIFDNWRVLHGRSAFEGLRRMCGAYINRDDFVSRWKTTNFARDHVIEANMLQRSHPDAVLAGDSCSKSAPLWKSKM